MPGGLALLKTARLRSNVSMLIGSAFDCRPNLRDPGILAVSHRHLDRSWAYIPGGGGEPQGAARARTSCEPSSTWTEGIGGIGERRTPY